MAEIRVVNQFLLLREQDFVEAGPRMICVLCRSSFLLFREQDFVEACPESPIPAVRGLTFLLLCEWDFVDVTTGLPKISATYGQLLFCGANFAPRIYRIVERSAWQGRRWPRSHSWIALSGYLAKI